MRTTPQNVFFWFIRHIFFVLNYGKYCTGEESNIILSPGMDCSVDSGILDKAILVRAKVIFVPVQNCWKLGRKGLLR